MTPLDIIIGRIEDLLTKKKLIESEPMYKRSKVESLEVLFKANLALYQQLSGKVYPKKWEP